MPPSSGSSRRSRPSRSRRTRHPWRFVSALVLFAVAIASSAFLLNRLRADREAAIEPPSADVAGVPSTPELDLSSLPTAASQASGVVYPYSIVPGGVDSVAALKAAIERDPVVAAHYRDFDIDHARVERLETPRVAHVSYRIGNGVFWTRKQLVLPAGERVITDGTHIARTRCGNQLAATPAVTSPAEPSARRWPGRRRGSSRP